MIITRLDDVKKNCKYVDKVDSNGIVICKCGDSCCCQWQLENTVFYSCDNKLMLLLESTA